MKVLLILGDRIECPELIVVLAVANGVCALGLAYAERRVEPGLLIRRAFAGAVVLAALVALGAVFVLYGGPARLVERGYDAFKAPPPHAVNLNRRLLSFSGNGRADLWRLAWDDSQLYTTGSLTVVPEPSTFILCVIAALSACGCAILHRRRRAT